MNNEIMSKESTTSYTHIFFYINKVLYSVPVYCVVEALQFCELQAPQKLQEHTVGLLNYKGLLLNVIDISQILGFEKKEYRINQNILILKTEEAMFGIIVDKILTIMDINTSELQVAPYNTKKLIQSIYDYDGKTASILNIPALEEEIKQSQIIDDKIFQLPILNTTDSKIAKLRAERIQQKGNSYSLTKYFDYTKYFIFSVGETKFCVEISHIEKIIDTKGLEITPIPAKAEYIEGLINFRGTFLTIINFANFIGQPVDINIDFENKKIIIFDVNDFKVAFLVDKIYEIINITSDEIIEENEYSNIYPFVRQQIVKNDEIYFIIDTDMLFKDDKMYINE